MTKKTTEFTAKEYEKMGRAVEELYLFGKISPKRFILMNFTRGVIYGFGLFIGGTIVVAIVLAVLTQFNEAPLIGPFIEQIVEIVQGTNQIPGK